MKIGAVLEEMKEHTTKDVADRIGINKSTLQRRLKKIGFTYNAESSEWEWLHETDAPLDMDINGQSGQTSNEQSGQKEEKIIYRTGHTDVLHSDEIAMLREIIKEWQKGPQKGTEAEIKPLHNRIIEIPDEEKKRKTVVINRSASDRLDQFAHDHKLDKQDIMYLAIMDFLDKYE